MVYHERLRTVFFFFSKKGMKLQGLEPRTCRICLQQLVLLFAAAGTSIHQLLSLDIGVSVDIVTK